MSATLELPVKEKEASLQDEYLGQLSANKTNLAVYLVNGIRLIGSVERFDAFTITLVNDSVQQLVYKHAISTISPAGDVRPGAPHEERTGSHRKREERRGRFSH